jgi:hypothetical protein
VDRYLKSTDGALRDCEPGFPIRPGWAKPFIREARILNENGEPQNIFGLGSEIAIEMSFQSPGGKKIKPVMGLVINHSSFGAVAGVNMRQTGDELETSFSEGILQCKLKHLPLLQGNYTIDLWLGDGPGDVDTVSNFLSFTIEPTDIYESGKVPFSHLGVIFLDARFEMIPELIR